MDQRDNSRNTHRMGRYGFAGQEQQHAGIGMTNAITFQQDVIEPSQRTPILVDVMAEWCGPCKQLAPYLTQLAQRYSGRLIVFSLDGDQSPALVQQFGIRAYPTLLLFFGGQVMKRHPGSPGTLDGLVNFVEPLP